MHRLHPHPAVHITTYFTSNSHTFQDKHFLPPLTFPHCPGLNWDAQKKTSMGDVESFWLCSWIAEISILKIGHKKAISCISQVKNSGGLSSLSKYMFWIQVSRLLNLWWKPYCVPWVTSHHTSCLYLGSPPYLSSLLGQWLTSPVKFAVKSWREVLALRDMWSRTYFPHCCYEGFSQSHKMSPQHSTPTLGNDIYTVK